MENRPALRIVPSIEFSIAFLALQIQSTNISMLLTLSSGQSWKRLRGVLPKRFFDIVLYALENQHTRLAGTRGV